MEVSIRLRNAVKVHCEMNAEVNNWSEVIKARNAAVRISEGMIFNDTLLELASIAIHVDRDWFELEMEKQGYGHFASTIYLALGNVSNNPVTKQLRAAIEVMKMPEPDMGPDVCPQEKYFENEIYRKAYMDEFRQLVNRGQLQHLLATLNDNPVHMPTTLEHAPIYAKQQQTEV